MGAAWLGAARLGVIKWAFGSMPGLGRWSAPCIESGEGFERWRMRASGELAELSRQALSERARHAGPRSWGVSLGRAMKGLAAGHLISASLLSESKDGRLPREIAGNGWIIPFWYVACERRDLGVRQRSARADQGAPLPLAQSSEASGAKSWVAKALQGLEWVLFVPLAPIAWFFALGLQSALAGRCFGMACAALQIAAAEMAEGSPEKAFQGWLEACRWLEMFGSDTALAQVMALGELGSASGAMALGVVRDVDAGWRRAGSAADEASRRLQLEDGLAGISAMLMLGSAIGRAGLLKGPSRQRAALGAFGLLAVHWESKAPAFARSEPWRWQEMAVSACELLGDAAWARELFEAGRAKGAGDGHPDSVAGSELSWERMSAKAASARSMDRAQSWPADLSKAVAKKLATDAALLACAQAESAFAMQGAAKGPWPTTELASWAGKWARLATAALEGWGLDSSELAAALMVGAARNPNAQLAAMFVGPWHEAQEVLALECAKAGAELEAKEVLRAISPSIEGEVKANRL